MLPVRWSKVLPVLPALPVRWSKVLPVQWRMG
jgi:hypothetical protein